MSRSWRQYRYRLASTPLVQPEVDVARGLHHPLALHDSFAGLVVAALGQVILQHRGGRFFDLQEQRVLLIAALQQHNERPRTDAANADDLAGCIDDLESFEQVPSIVLQRRAIGPELLMNRVSQLVSRHANVRREFTSWDDDGWLADDPVLAVDLLRQLREGLQAVAGVCLQRVLPRVLSAVCAAFLSAPLRELVMAATAPSRSSSDWCAYQMSIVRISAKPAIACRYACAAASVASCAWVSVKPLLRARS